MGLRLLSSRTRHARLCTWCKSSNFAPMKILDAIRNWGRKDNHTLRYNTYAYGMPFELTRHKFGETEYLNIVQILTDLYAEVVWSSVADSALYKAWQDFVNRNGQRILTQLLTGAGYAVIGYHAETDYKGQQVWYFYELPTTAYTVTSSDNRTYISAVDTTQLFYVLKSPTYELTGKSDHEWCKPFIAMLDAVLNGATTTAERLGAYVVMSPKSDNYGGEIDEKEKDELEKAIAKDYGMLGKQKQMLLLSRPMDSQIVSLAGVDTRMNDKARAAVLSIADRLKVPANQIAFIDGGQSKSFANGTEYREGDVAKYRTFRRLLNATFYDMATELGMKVNYEIENEPKTTQGQNIEQA